MIKHLMTSTVMILVVLVLSVSAQAKKPVQKLKDPVKNFSEHNARFEEILDLGVLAIPDLISLVEEQTADDMQAAKHQWAGKVSAMNLLSELKAKDALPVLQAMLETSDNLSAINNSARTIGRIGGNQSFKILKQVFINTQNFKYSLNDHRKRAVIAALGLCESKKAVPLLMEALENPNNDQMIRIYAAGSLGLMGVQDGLQTAVDGLSSDDANVKLAAIRALGLIGSPSSVAALNRAMAPDLKYVYRKAAKLSLIQIKEKQQAGNKKIAYIHQQLIENPQLTEVLQWGTMKLKKINTQGAKKALYQLSEETSPEFIFLKHAAKLRLKTMD